MESPTERLAKLIESRLRQLKQTRFGAARAAGLPVAAIRTVLAGHSPRYDRLVEICRALGLEIRIEERAARTRPAPAATNDPDAFYVLAHDRRMEPSGIYEGMSCLVSPKAAVRPGCRVWVEWRSGRKALRWLVERRGRHIEVLHWQPASKPEWAEARRETIPEGEIDRLAAVVAVSDTAEPDAP